MGLIDRYSRNTLRGQEFTKLLKILDQPVRDSRSHTHNRAPQMTADTQKLVLDAYKRGIPVRDIAAEHGIHRGTVTELIRAVGAPLRRKGPNNSQLKVAIDMYEDGGSLATVGRRLGVDAMTVRTWLLRAGVTIRPRNGWSK